MAGLGGTRGGGAKPPGGKGGATTPPGKGGKGGKKGKNGKKGKKGKNGGVYPGGAVAVIMSYDCAYQLLQNLAQALGYPGIPKKKKKKKGKKDGKKNGKKKGK